MAPGAVCPPPGVSVLVRTAIAALLAVVAASAALVTAEPAVVLVLALVAAGLTARRGFPWRRAGRMLWRLKWFYLSLVLFYGLWPSGGAFATGLAEAGWRILALMLVVLLVVWLTERFPRAVLVQALGSILSGPRQASGGGRRFAQRLFLALELFERERPLLERRRGALVGPRRERLAAVRDWLVERLDRALAGDVGPLEGAATNAAVPGTVPWSLMAGVAWVWSGAGAAWALWLW